MRRALVALLVAVWPAGTEAMTVKCTGAGPCSGTLTFTGTVVSSMALNATLSDGVLVAEWSCSGSSECGEERDRTQLALYDRGVLAVVLTLDPSSDPALSERHVGGTLAWVGRAGVLARAGR